MPDPAKIRLHLFALARFGRFMQSQPAQTVHFDSNGVQLMRDGTIIQHWNWDTIRFIGLVYAQGPASLLGMFTANLPSGSRQSCITIATEKKETQLWLEEDVHYAGRRLIDWLEDLYAAGIEVRESNGRGEKTRLLREI